MSDETARGDAEKAVDEIKDIYGNVENEIILQYLSEQRSDRRWKTIRRVFITLMVVFGIVLYSGTLAGSLGYRMLPTTPSIAVVPVSGVIANNTEASAESVIVVLERLFDTEAVEGIVLLIDSGGGSPTEAERITRFIDAQQARTGKPVVAVCASMCASAAYMIAIHADKIYAGEYSWTGSIGAIMKGWDVNKVMDRFEIDQRVFASGDLKDLMNPFAPMSPEMTAKLDQLVDKTAENFANEVKSLRGDALTTQEDLFTGEVWTGKDSLRLGLVDNIGTLETVLELEFEGLPSAMYRPKKRGNTLFDSVLGNIGRGFAEALLERQGEIQL